MEAPSSDHLAWTCPACARRVPRRVEVCRCGFAQADLPLDPPTTTMPEPDPPASKRGMLLAIGFVVLFGVAMIPVWTRINTPAPAAMPAAVLEPPPVAQGADSARAAIGRVLRSPGFVPESTPSAATMIVPTPSTPSSLEDVVSRVIPAVALIDAGTSRGTGFFIRTDQVLTNAHVVQGQTTVQLHVGNATYTARVVMASSGTDLALLQVSNPNPTQQTLRLGSVSTARPGQEVVAVGSALGVLSNTVTRGIV